MLTSVLSACCVTLLAYDWWRHSYPYKIAHQFPPTQPYTQQRAEQSCSPPYPTHMLLSYPIITPLTKHYLAISEFLTGTQHVVSMHTHTRTHACSTNTHKTAPTGRQPRSTQSLVSLPSSHALSPNPSHILLVCGFVSKARRGYSRPSPSARTHPLITHHRSPRTRLLSQTGTTPHNTCAHCT